METILVIDDEKRMHRILQISLEGLGYSVISASSGLEGVELAKARMPSLVITDMKMPGMSGMEVLQEIKKSDGGILLFIDELHNIVGVGRAEGEELVEPRSGEHGDGQDPDHRVRDDQPPYPRGERE